MSFANRPEEYEIKKKRLDDAMNFREPDRVPVMMFNGTWGYGYAGIKIEDVIHDRRKLIEGGLKWCEDIYADAYYVSAVAAPILIYEVLEPPHPMYGLSSDGYSFEHFQANEAESGMLAEEYPELIADVKKYILETICPRRYPKLAQPYPANYEVMKQAYAATMEYMGSLFAGADVAKELYGLTSPAGALSFAPLDFLFDYLRGFKGIILDIRKRPEQVLEACEVLEQYEEKLYLPLVTKGSTVSMPLHIAPFLGPKNFEKFYWPTLKKYMDAIIKKKAKVNLVLEGDWTPYMDYLMEFPKGSIIANVEKGDFFEFKKKYGDQLVLIGGLPLDTILFGKKEECVDLTKKLIDECGPGGGFILSTDKTLQFKNDLNIDNYSAVIDTLLTYGGK